MAKTSLDKLFAPERLAIVGASDNPDRIAGKPQRFTVEAGFQGEVYPVNPGRAEIQGMNAYPTLAEVPETPDVALICLSSKHVKSTVETCGEMGIPAAVIFASGYAETGEAGAVQQSEIAEVARQSGVRLLGPNCLGVFNTHSGFIGSFASTFEDGPMSPGPVAIVSQSGAYGAHVSYMCKQRGIGIGYWVSTGNEIDVDVADAIDWLASRDDVTVIMAYAEGIRNGASLVAALAKARDHGKTVVFNKAGVSSVGKQAAESHTAAMAGEDTVVSAVFQEFGVLRVPTAEAHVDVAAALCRGSLPSGRKVGLVSLSGGFGIQLSDAAERWGLEVAPMPEATRAKLAPLAPLGSMRNPFDVTAAALNDLEVLPKTFEAMFTEGGLDCAIGHFTTLPWSPSVAPRLKSALIDLPSRFPEKPIALVMIAPDAERQEYERAGYHVYTDSEFAARAMAAMASAGEARSRIADQERPVTADPVPLRKGLTELEAGAVLEDYGIRYPMSRLVETPEEAAQAWSELGPNVAMKIVSPDILHKSDVGGVRLGVDSAEAAAAAYRDIVQAVSAAVPDAQLAGVMVVSMIPKGVEVILGANMDPTFGPVVLVGHGGILAELIGKTSLRRAPLSRRNAEALVTEAGLDPLLNGLRGARPADRAALVDMIVALGAFAAANAEQLSSVDINPVVVLPKGNGAYALDAVIETRNVVSNTEEKEVSRV